MRDPEHQSPGTGVSPAIRTRSISARCWDRSVTAAPGSRDTAGPARFPWHSRFRRVFGARSVCPSFILCGSAASQPLSAPTSSSGEACQLLAPRRAETKRKRAQARCLLLPQQLWCQTCPGTSSQPLVNEIPPNTLQRLCRQALPSLTPGKRVQRLVTPEKLETLDMTQKNFRDLLFSRKFAT